MAKGRQAERQRRHHVPPRRGAGGTQVPGERGEQGEGALRDLRWMCGGGRDEIISGGKKMFAGKNYSPQESATHKMKPYVKSHPLPPPKSHPTPHHALEHVEHVRRRLDPEVHLPYPREQRCEVGVARNLRELRAQPLVHLARGRALGYGQEPDSEGGEAACVIEWEDGGGVGGQERGGVAEVFEGYEVYGGEAEEAVACGGGVGVGKLPRNQSE